MNSTDDQYFNINGYEAYVPTAINPGPWMVVGVCIYSFVCIIAVPPLVILGNRYEKRRSEKGKYEDDEDSETLSESSKKKESKEITPPGTVEEAVADGEIETMLSPRSSNNLGQEQHARFVNDEYDFKRVSSSQYIELFYTL